MFFHTVQWYFVDKCDMNHKFYFTLLKFILNGMDTQLIFHNSIDVSVHFNVTI